MSTTTTTTPETAPAHLAGRGSTYTATRYGIYHTEGQRIGYATEAAWADQMAERNPILDAVTYRRLIEAVNAGLPVLLTVRWYRLWGDRKYLETSTVLVTDLVVRGDKSNSDRIRTRSWGFTKDVYLSVIAAVEIPGVTSEKVEEF